MDTLDRAETITVTEIALYERDVTFRMPFRFGVVTLTEAPQAFVRVRVRGDGGRESWGVAAEMLAPKWFDKNLELSNEDNFDQLRSALWNAAGMYRDAGPDTAFGLFAACYPMQIRTCANLGLNPLVASFGPALIDRAILDGLCKLHQTSIFAAVNANLPGIAPERLLPEFEGFDMAAFLAGLRPAASIHARHTVGMVDPIVAADRADDEWIDDGLPETLEQVIAVYGHRYFKLKVGGDVDADVARLSAIAAVLDRLADPYVVSLDGNEQYRDVDGVLGLWRAMKEAPALQRLVASIAFIEQPIARAVALERDVGVLAAERPVIIDESDGDLDAFASARQLGYAGVSSKACKGFYKSLINAARCARWNREEGHLRYFMSGEDLTTQAGVCVQQDLAIATLIGVDHVERNGHHYVDGMRGVPTNEQAAFLAAHPDLYRRADGVVRLRIEDGRIALGSLDCAGFAVGADPDFSAMRPMPQR